MFVANATAGVNAVLRSLTFVPGDELLVTTHTYAACRKTVDYVAARCNARVGAAPLPFPLQSDQQIVDAVLACVTERTRLALLDHVTSPTALVLPLQRLVSELQARNVDTLVDGAHAPGMVPVALARLGAAYYTGNAHKWLCAPKGAAFLHVRRDRQAEPDDRACLYGLISPIDQGSVSSPRNITTSSFSTATARIGRPAPSGFQATCNALGYAPRMNTGR